MFIYDLVNVQKYDNFLRFLPKNACLRSTAFIRAFSSHESVDIVGGNSRDASGIRRLRTVVENIWSKDRAISWIPIVKVRHKHLMMFVCGS